MHVDMHMGWHGHLGNWFSVNDMVVEISMAGSYHFPYNRNLSAMYYYLLSPTSIADYFGYVLITFSGSISVGYDIISDL